MMYRETDRKAPMSPQLALRVAIIGGVALVIFGIIFFRLWYLQVLSGDQYLAEANNNRVREIKVEAPRGKIVDRDGADPGRQPPGQGGQDRARQAARGRRARRRSSTRSSRACST